ncbi:MAG TPA: UDP-glucose/GDP-mannose dehydrogenase family protein, partial [Flavisolibacter sp.]
HLVNKIKRYYNNDLAGKHFAVWGLAFKPNTDDIREAPALEIIRELLSAGATVSAFDPEAMNNVKVVLGDTISFAEGQYECLENADALIVATEWNEFRTPDFDKVLSSLKDAVIFDGRNVYDVEQMEKKGFHYESIGRPLVNQPKLV